MADIDRSDKAAVLGILEQAKDTPGGQPAQVLFQFPIRRGIVHHDQLEPGPRPCLEHMADGIQGFEPPEIDRHDHRNHCRAGRGRQPGHAKRHACGIDLFEPRLVVGAHEMAVGIHAGHRDIRRRGPVRIKADPGHRAKTLLPSEGEVMRQRAHRRAAHEPGLGPVVPVVEARVDCPALTPAVPQVMAECCGPCLADIGMVGQVELGVEEVLPPRPDQRAFRRDQRPARQPAQATHARHGLNDHRRCLGSQPTARVAQPPWQTGGHVPIPVTTTVRQAPPPPDP